MGRPRGGECAGFGRNSCHSGFPTLGTVVETVTINFSCGGEGKKEPTTENYSMSTSKKEKTNPSKVEHGPKGGVPPEDLRHVRHVQSMMLDEEGKHNVLTFPDWFQRTGIRTAEVDTGFGTVRVKAIAFEEDELESDSGYSRLLTSLLRTPEWVMDFDSTCLSEDGVTLAQISEGETIPSPGDILAMKDHKVSRWYVEECLPPSLMQQLLTAIFYLRVPLLATVPPQKED